VTAMTAIIPSLFVAGETGTWRILSIQTVTGEGLPPAPRLAVESDSIGSASAIAGSSWALKGVAGHARYVQSAEKSALARVQPPLGREQATLAALIPIRKSPEWWDLAQDERRAIIEERSQHIAVGLRYLPAIARRLYQARELGEPFDFLTWFEYAPEHAASFEELTSALRATEEWKYVDREVDVRLAR